MARFTVIEPLRFNGLRYGTPERPEIDLDAAGLAELLPLGVLGEEVAGDQGAPVPNDGAPDEPAAEAPAEPIATDPQPKKPRRSAK